MKILCCADLHLGRSSSVMRSELGEDLSAMAAWNRIVDAAVGDGAHSVVIAGDVFDGLGAYVESREGFLKGLLRLKERSIPVVAVSGNHDWEALPRFCRKYPDSGITLLGIDGNWDSVEIGDVCYLGWSFTSEVCTSRSFDRFEGVSSNLPIVGILHCDSGSDRYNRVQVADFDRAANAWVLGHIHLPSPVGPKARYPGSPQALDFGPGEQGVHGFLWLEFDQGVPKFSEVQPVSSVLFARHSLSVDLNGETDPVHALGKAVDTAAATYRSSNPHLTSVHLRITAEVENWSKSETGDVGSDPRDFYEFVQVVPKFKLDLWREFEAQDAAAELARMLIGLKGMNTGEHAGKPVDPDWIAEARRQVEPAAEEVRSAYAKYLGPAQDVGDAAYVIGADTCWEIAKDAIEKYFEAELRNARKEEAA